MEATMTFNPIAVTVHAPLPAPAPAPAPRNILRSLRSNLFM